MRHTRAKDSSFHTRAGGELIYGWVINYASPLAVMDNELDRTKQSETIDAYNHAKAVFVSYWPAAFLRFVNRPE